MVWRARTSQPPNTLSVAAFAPILVYDDASGPATLAPGHPEPPLPGGWGAGSRHDWDAPWDGWPYLADADTPRQVGWDRADPATARKVRWETTAERHSRARKEYVVLQAACPDDGVRERYHPRTRIGTPSARVFVRVRCSRGEPCEKCAAHPAAVTFRTGEAWREDLDADEPTPPPSPVEPGTSHAV